MLGPGFQIFPERSARGCSPNDTSLIGSYNNGVNGIGFGNPDIAPGSLQLIVQDLPSCYQAIVGGQFVNYHW